MLFDPKKLDQFPQDPGVYIMKDVMGTVLYVGKAKNVKKRVKQYFIPGRDGRPMVPHLTSQVAEIETIVVPAEKDALLLENTLIKRHWPKFNVLLKDDKMFISLMINNKHEWPMIRIVRLLGKPKKNGLYFGPYTNAYAARQTFELMTRLFPLRQCSDDELKRRTRPCLLYDIKRCIAPCVGKCSKEEYQTFVNGAIQFLKGNNKDIIPRLKAAMKKASEELEFEEAAALLTTIRQIEQVTAHKDSVVVKAAAKDCDALAIYREGDSAVVVRLVFREGNLIGSEHDNFEKFPDTEEELLSSYILQHYQRDPHPPKEILLPFALPDQELLSEILSIHLVLPQKGDKKALIHLAEKNAKAIYEQEKEQRDTMEQRLLDMVETLKLNRYPKRIECFDTSNISGSDLVAALVAFVDGKKDKSRTRKYIIRDIHKPDDYAALHQVLSRRLIRAKQEDDLPDLILIDGGKGQLNIALDVFKELDIASVDVISLAKEEGRHDRGMRKEAIFVPHHKDPIQLDVRSPTLLLLQQIRDEVHRTAISFHRQRRQKRTIKSALDSVPGIGPIKKKKLLTHFGSIERIRKASDEELKLVKGIADKDIRALRENL